MNTRRTGGMTAVGILNIIFGSFASIGALVTVLGGGLMAAIGSAAEQEMTGATGEAAAFGGALILLGLFGLTIGVMLLVAGIGVLMVKPWGRNLSLAAATLAIVNNIGQAVLLSAFGLGTVIGMAYPIILIGLFMNPSWKAAFSGQPQPSEDVPVQGPSAMNVNPNNVRDAA